jgi:hypothetical protein
MKLKKLSKLLREFKENDPVYSCKVYKDLGCSHVDGFLCDFPDCSINKKYLLELEMFELEQQLDIPFKLRYYNSK